jgi:hypothetical protein
MQGDPAWRGVLSADMDEWEGILMAHTTMLVALGDRVEDQARVVGVAFPAAQ